LEDFVWHLIIVAAGGIAVLLVAHYSRKNWISKYGKPSGKNKLRFLFCLVGGYLVLTFTAYNYPFIFIIFIAIFFVVSQISVGPLDIFHEKPGLRKDIIYGTTISSILAGFTALFIPAP